MKYVLKTKFTLTQNVFKYINWILHLYNINYKLLAILQNLKKRCFICLKIKINFDLSLLKIICFMQFTAYSLSTTRYLRKVLSMH